MWHDFVAGEYMGVGDICLRSLYHLHTCVQLVSRNGPFVGLTLLARLLSSTSRFDNLRERCVGAISCVGCMCLLMGCDQWFESALL